MKRLSFLLPLVGLLLNAGVTELHGPPSRQAARNLRTDRADGTAQYLEFSFAPVPAVSGFTRLEVYTGKHEGSKFARFKLSERDLQIPNVLRYAREFYDFNLPSFGSGSQASQRPPGPAALAENRIVLLSSAPVGTSTEFTLRTLGVTSLNLGRAIVVPAGPTGIALRPGSSEVWTIHSGNNNLIAIADLSIERLATTIQLRLQPQAVAVALAFSPNGRSAYVVVRNADAQPDRGFIQVWDCVTRTLRSTITLGSTQPVNAVLSPDGTNLVIVGNALNDLNLPSPSLSFFNTISSTAELAALGLGGSGSLPTIEQFAFHPDGSRVYLLASVTIETFDIQSRRIIRSTPTPRASKPNAIDVSPYGDLILLRDSLGQQTVLMDSGTLEILDTQPFANGSGFLLLRP